MGILGRFLEAPITAPLNRPPERAPASAASGPDSIGYCQGRAARLAQ